MVMLPNVLSCLRLCFVPVLLVLAWSNNSKPFFYCLIISVLTDTIDGFLARQMDSAADSPLPEVAGCPILN